MGVLVAEFVPEDGSGASTLLVLRAVWVLQVLKVLKELKVLKVLQGAEVLQRA